MHQQNDNYTFRYRNILKIDSIEKYTRINLLHLH
jgi:hypothetical protein